MNLPTLLSILFLVAVAALITLVLWAICKAGGDADDLSERVLAELRKAKNESHS
jgi:hypothetical protein